MGASNTSPEIAFFVTCLVDQVLPEVGVAAVRLLREAGYRVAFPHRQTCCGQPFFNSGLTEEAIPLARHTVALLEPYEAVVLPSGSCAAFIRHEYPRLLAPWPEWHARAEQLAAKTFELTQFLVHRAQWHPARRVPGAPVVTYHDSCHMARGLGVRAEPRQLLQEAGYPLVEMAEPDFCCGFGGVFSLRMPEVSNAITREKLRMAQETGAPVIATADTGCLMQMRGLLKTNGIRVEHVACLLAKTLEGS